eukprot:752780-Hanusia_phi.AAC.2
MKREQQARVQQDIGGHESRSITFTAVFGSSISGTRHPSTGQVSPSRVHPDETVRGRGGAGGKAAASGKAGFIDWKHDKQKKVGQGERTLQQLLCDGRARLCRVCEAILRKSESERPAEVGLAGTSYRHGGEGRARGRSNSSCMLVLNPWMHQAQQEITSESKEEEGMDEVRRVEGKV